LDDLPFGEMYIEISTKNAIEFKQGWAAGLNALLKKLVKDNVPKTQIMNPEAVAKWWNIKHSKENHLVYQDEMYISNSFPVISLPKTIYVHKLSAMVTWDTLKIRNPANALYPYKDYAISFIDAAKMNERYGKFLFIENTTSFDLNDFLRSRRLESFMNRAQRRDAFYNLLKNIWENTAIARGLKVFYLSGNVNCFYFEKDLRAGDIFHYKDTYNKTRYRQLVGNYRGAYWHFALQAIPIIDSQYTYTFKAHIVFSDDGHVIWESVKSSHRARRSMCKLWWNDKWRDLLSAAISWLCSASHVIILGNDEEEMVKVKREPIRFISPVSTNQKMSNEIPDDYEYGIEDDFDLDELSEEGE
jgi:hypothetical protein